MQRWACGQSQLGSQKKWAARCRTAHSLCRNQAPLQRLGDVGHHFSDLCADSTHHGDRSDGDQRGDQRVFDGGGAMLTLHQTAENGQHWYLQRKRNVLLTLTSVPAHRPTVVGTNEAIDMSAGDVYASLTSLFSRGMRTNILIPNGLST